MPPSLQLLQVGGRGREKESRRGRERGRKMGRRGWRARREKESRRGRERGREMGGEGGRFIYYIHDTHFFAAWFNAVVLDIRYM